VAVKITGSYSIWLRELSECDTWDILNSLSVNHNKLLITTP